MKTLFILLAMLASGGWHDSVLYLCGATSIEDLDQSVIEHYNHLTEHPLDINSASRSALVSSGLFSNYQAVSIRDYRASHGDILSYIELATVDGIGDRMADALRPFTVLKSHAAPGHAAGMDNRISASATLRATGRQDAGQSGVVSLGAKLSAEWNESVSISGAGKYSHDKLSVSEITSISATYNAKRLPLNIYLGDFNIRLGQGVLIWSGFSMTSLPAVNAFAKRASGISRSLSFSADSHLRGVAASLSSRQFDYIAAYLPQTRTVVGSCSWNRRHFRLGANALYGQESAGASADFQLGYGNFSSYGEVAVDISKSALAACLGSLWRPSYGSEYSIHLRALSPHYSVKSAGMLRSTGSVADEIAALAGVSVKSFNIVAEYVYHPLSIKSQVRSMVKYKRTFPWGPYQIIPELRLSGRYRPEDPNPVRTDLRSDVELGRDVWMIHARYNVLWYEARSSLAYLEAGYRGAVTAYLRGTVFDVGMWNDRIYVYERDAPGAFNVPAYYGRGWNASAVVSFRLRTGRLSHRFYARCSLVTYPGSDKASRIDARLQYTLVI